jgi:SAM-dependent methyltransferase
MNLPMDVTEVRNSEPLPLMVRVDSEYRKRFGDDPEDRGGWYEPDGWKRISRVLERLDLGGDLLDVGSGAGQFANCAAISGCFRSVTTTDPTRFNKYIELAEDIVRLNESIHTLPFESRSFDVVTCMEVLEHLPSDIFEDGIGELRRVCGGQLVITVPYREPDPMSKTHVRRFEDEDLLRLFPDAQFTLLRRPDKPWVLIEEYPNGYPDTRSGRTASSIGSLTQALRRAELDNEKLRQRKSIRTANWVGRRYRRARSAISDVFKIE